MSTLTGSGRSREEPCIALIENRGRMDGNTLILLHIEEKAVTYGIHDLRASSRRSSLYIDNGFPGVLL